MIAYAVLALLAAGVVVALLAIDSGGGGESVPSVAGTSRAEMQAARIEERLAANPGSEMLLVATMRAWIGAGAARLYALDLDRQPIPDAVVTDYKASLRAWNRYLRLNGGDADGDIAEKAGDTYFQLLEIGSRDLDEIETNAVEAARGLQIAGRHEPNLFTLSNTALYSYFAGQFVVGDVAARRATADAEAGDTPKDVLMTVRNQLEGFRELGETFRRQLREAAAELEESGDDELDEPLRAFTASVNLNKEPPE